MNHSFRFVALLLGLMAAALVARADGARFSSSLSPEQRERAGLSQLTGDELAVVDGLVRQDEAASRFKDNGVDHTHFTERHTAHERAIAGIDRLAPAQRAQLDELVRLRLASLDADLAAADAAFRDDSDSAGYVNVTMAKLPPPEIHGEVGYTIGTSKRGTFQGVDTVLTYDDPAHKYSVLVAYSQYWGNRK